MIMGFLSKLAGIPQGWLLAIVLAAGIGIGDRIGAWRTGAAANAAAIDVADKHAAEVGDLNNKIGNLTADKHDLELAVAEQNKAIAVAAAETRAAEAAKVEAEKRAADAAKASQSRLQKLEAAFAAATTCDGVLRPYWDLRR